MRIIKAGKPRPQFPWTVGLWVCAECGEEVEFDASDAGKIEYHDEGSQPWIVARCSTCERLTNFTRIPL